MEKDNKFKSMKPDSGKILISEPFLKDFFFKRSIILLAEHNEEGSFGLILNKPIDVNFNEVLQGFPEFEANIYLGGPVKTDNIFILHTKGDKISDSTPLLDGLYWGGDIEHIKDLILTGNLSPEEIRFYVGYSGWAADQLDDELKESSWVVANFKPEFYLKTPAEIMWDNAVKKLGGDYVRWINYPIDPSLN